MCRHNEENECAKEKVKFMFVCLLFVICVGGVWEMLKAQAPLDTVVVVYNRSEINKQLEDNEKITKEDVVLEEKAVEAKVRETSYENVGVEFLNYIEHVKAEVENVEPKVFVLDRIVVEKKEVEKNEEIPFKDGQIEVYDSEKGVVDVIVEEDNKVETAITEEVNEVENVEEKVEDVKINADIEVKENIEDVKSDDNVEIIEMPNVENHESLNMGKKAEEVLEKTEKNTNDKLVDLKNETVNMMESIIANQ